MPRYMNGVPSEIQFWMSIDFAGPTPPGLSTPCWLWMLGQHNKGYGKFWHAGGHVRAHRFAWELLRSPVPDGMFVLHHCDTPPCCNPGHLFLGTVKDNVQDMIRKGRAGFRTALDRFARGERVNTAKLTIVDILAIDAELASGASSVQLGKKYGVGSTAILRIKHRKSWKHVPRQVAGAP